MVSHEPSRADDVSLQILKAVQKIQEDNVRYDARFASLESKMEQWETRSNNLQTYVTQLSDSINDKQARSSGASPSNTVINPKSLNSITLRSGKHVRFQDVDDKDMDGELDEEIICEAPPLSHGDCSNSESPDEEHSSLPSTTV